MVVDRDLRYVEVNAAYELLTGKARSELLGRALFEAFPGSDNADGSSQADVVRASLERVLATGERDVLALIPYAIESRTAMGEIVVDTRYWSATHTPLFDADGDVTGVMQNTSDVTEVEQLRDAVRAAREATGVTPVQREDAMRLRAAAVQQDNARLAARDRFLTDMFAQAPGFMAVLRGPDHVFELANAAYETLVGRSGFIGRPLADVMPELAGQGFFDLLDNVRNTGVPFVGRAMPVVLREPSGGERTLHVDFVYQPVHGPGGEVESIFVQGADVTDHQLAQQSLRDANQQKDRFLAMLAHELRNPLAPIANSAQLLRMAPGDPGLVERSANIIDRQVGHMRALVEDLVDVSRLTRGLVSLRREPVAVAAMLSAAVEQNAPLFEQKHHLLSIKDRCGAAIIDVDRVRITQVLANLLNNAAKYSPPATAIRLEATCDGNDLVFRVEDAGHGMDPAVQARMFELFAQGRTTSDRYEGGLGIGLPLARSLAELHGGTLTGHSAGPGLGSVFELRIPAVPMPVPVPAGAA